MLRRKLSSGLLRAAANASQVAATALPASPIQQQSANLASAVLLSSARSWREETVVTLKTELKRRGLSQQGNKATLVARLSSADTSALLPPVPQLPRSTTITTTTTSITPNLTRNMSTTSPRSLPSKAKKPVRGSASGSSQVSSTGPEISAPVTEAPVIEPVTAEEVTVAPGLPETKDAGKKVEGETLDVKMPTPPAEEEVDQVIPLTPDNFRSNQALPSSAPPSDTIHLPKVVTVASASTHHAGGPTHAVYDAGDAHTIETTVKASEDTMSGLAKDLPSLGSAINTALAAPGKAWSTAGLSKSLIPEIGLPKGGAKEEYKLPNKGLGPDEKRGVYILAGIVGLGFLVGGSGKGKVAEKAEHAVKSERGVKGDARWAKASGAGIVGHGVRKD